MIDFPEDSVKWSLRKQGQEYSGCIPMWVADMDFPAPVAVTTALVDRAKIGYFGYSNEPEGYRDSIVKWYKKRHNLLIEQTTILPVPGVITGINLALQSLLTPKDTVLLCTPSYPPFYRAIADNGLATLTTLLAPSGEMDWDDIEKKLAKSKAWILCSPHNPTGKVYNQEELDKIVELCKKYNILLISDEIHSDLIAAGNSFISVLSLDWGGYSNYLVLSAPSKTFNLAGLSSSFFVIPDHRMYCLIAERQIANGPKKVNLMGLYATKAAYEHGEEWLEDTLSVIEQNRKFMIDFLKENIPEIRVAKPQGTYFLWLNCSLLLYSQATAAEFFKEEAKLRLNAGENFGEEYTSFVRMNIACFPETIQEAAIQIKEAIQKLKK